MINESTLDGQTAVVTGSGHSIGQSMVFEFANHSVNAVIAARSEDEITSVAKMTDKQDGDAIAVPSDVTIMDNVMALFDPAEQGPSSTWASSQGKSASNKRGRTAPQTRDSEPDKRTGEETQETEIRVSAICPGQMNTELTDNIAAVVDSRPMRSLISSSFS